MRSLDGFSRRVGDVIRRARPAERAAAVAAVIALLAGAAAVFRPGGSAADLVQVTFGGGTGDRVPSSAGDGAAAGEHLPGGHVVAGIGPGPDPSEVPPGSPRGLGITTRHTLVRARPEPDAPPVSRLGPGVALPLGQRSGGFAAALTPCQLDGWVAFEDVRYVPAAAPRGPRDWTAATIVLDAGHGGAPGAVGPTGLMEALVNEDVIRRLASLLSASRDVDWTTGAITAGDTYAAPTAVLTRVGDYHAGLRYRSEIANALAAHAFLSVHHNAEPDGPMDRPGTEVFHQSASAESRRLAGLAYEEVVRALAVFAADWRGERDAGAKPRMSPRGGDYYSLLRSTQVPAILVEAAFISNASEEALLRRGEVRQAIADALYRSLVRYFTTSDPGSGFVDPYPRRGGPSGRLPSTCHDPA